ncbi:hypothetical protein GPL21_33405 [Bradyrhizobium pachyrhizi]|uniref:Uncharacterized protein n=1 Tax=Bradyrhizobium pachyrhizi TaxID=280333 RepID=A0A844SSA3_9BRAD|nr:hypothetical protein [Bradyrhizobium pachyrhizi]MVT69983.1 hypothetical protein [Bradyrhizobium pachyrhizi]
MTDVAKAERARIHAVTSLPEAAGREALALQLALNGLTTEQARAALLAAPVAAVGGRAGDSSIGLALATSKPEGQSNIRDVSAAWDGVLTARGMRLREGEEV